MTLCLIALGANLPAGERTPAQTLDEALARLAAEGVRPIRVSRWWRTPAHPPGSGPDFVNGAAACESALPAEGVLAALHRVEDALGRARPARWAPRSCDLDLIDWGGRIAPDADELRRWMALGDRAGALPAPDRLILPHPRAHERAFVLAPLAEVAPAWRHPISGLTAAQMLAALGPGAMAGMSPLPAGP